MQLAKVCIELSCTKVTTLGSRCALHQRERDKARDQQRGTSDARGYTRQFHNATKRAIAVQPYCSYCGTLGSRSNPLTGDHRVPVSKGGTIGDGVVPACRRCNSARGAKA